MLLAGTVVSVQELLENEPDEDVQDTLPVGLLGVLLPVSVTVAVQVVALPTCVVEGTQLTLVDVLRVTENVCAFDSPPPGAGLKTVIGKLPAVVTSPAGIAAVSWVELTNVVVRFKPSNRTTEPEMKLVPFTVSVNAPLI